MSDEYEPAIEGDSNGAEAGVESEPVERRAAPAAAPEPVAKIGEPPGEDEPTTIEQGPKLPRRWSDKSRALFRQVVKDSAGTPVGDELEPMEHTPAKPAPVAKPTPAAATSAPTRQPAAAPIADPAPAPPPGLPELPDLPLPAFDPAPAAAAPPTPDPKHAEREAQIAAREAQLVEREKLLPDRRALIENPGPALISWVKETYGITDDAELKTAVADLITDLSVQGLKIGVPEDHVTGMQSRKATRVVKVYAADVDKRERALQEKTAAQEKAAKDQAAKEQAKQQEAAYVTRLGELIAPAAGQYKFLNDPEVTGGLSPAAVVYEVMKEQQRIGQKPDLRTAVKFADDYYRSQAEALTKRASKFSTLLGTTAPVAAPAQPAAKPAAPAPAPSASPGGAPGPAPTPEAKPEPEREWDPSDLPMDRQQRRQASLAKILARNKAGQQPTP